MSESYKDMLLKKAGELLWGFIKASQYDDSGYLPSESEVKSLLAKIESTMDIDFETKEKIYMETESVETLHPSYMDTEEELITRQRPRSLSDVIAGLKKVARENRSDDDLDLLEKLEDEIRGLDFASFGQAALASKYALVGESFRGLVDKYKKPESYRFLHEEVLNKMTNAMNELSMRGGHRHKHRFTQCKKHRHCRYCGKKHH